MSHVLTMCVETGSIWDIEDEEGEERQSAPNSSHPFVSYQVRTLTE